MMKAALASILLLAWTYSASTETIICYSCSSVTDPPQSKLKSFLARHDSPSTLTDQCLDPIENSTTVAVDSAQYNCAEVYFKASNGVETAEELARGVLAKDTCPDLEENIMNECNQGGLVCTIDCSECTTDLCNVNLPHGPTTPPPTSELSL